MRALTRASAAVFSRAKSAFWIHGRAFSPYACGSPSWPTLPCGDSLIVAG
jgi:hypothetical protein